ncbi:amino acid ABC transporter permease [Terrilactibacillus tamarindi]|uniref:amino acid ABC transporter permease n=1 Tax=Terrilactibacillus tamarindi TaxID=2599694 RepID=UPI0012BCF491
MGIFSGFSLIASSIPYIINGVWTTLEIALVSAIIGFVLGVILSLFKIGNIKILAWLSDFYTSIFRGTPLILQLTLVYFATPQLIGYDISAFLAAIITFGFNSGAYMSEIIRSGINAVDKGQFEAAGALGVPYWSMMKDIILPQAIKKILPAMMNEFITLTKESAIVSTIGVLDLMRRAQVVAAENSLYFPPLIVSFAVYYVLVMILTILGRLFERRMSRSD